MFRREVQSIKELVIKNLRIQGLETPLLQRRLVEAWPTVAGEAISRFTSDPCIRNQTLFVHVSLPALRSDLSMKRAEFVRKLNEYVGAQIISDIRFV